MPEKELSVDLPKLSFCKDIIGAMNCDCGNGWYDFVLYKLLDETKQYDETMLNYDIKQCYEYGEDKFLYVKILLIYNIYKNPLFITNIYINNCEGLSKDPDVNKCISKYFDQIQNNEKECFVKAKMCNYLFNFLYYHCSNIQNDPSHKVTEFKNELKELKIKSYFEEYESYIIEYFKYYNNNIIAGLLMNELQTYFNEKK
jgi:hypothetical protein